MRAKTLLERVKLIDSLIKTKRKEISRLYDVAAGFSAIDYSKSKVTGGRMNSTEDRLINLSSNNETDKLKKEIKQLEDERKEILDLVYKLDDPNQVKVIYSRYFEDKDLVTIAREMFYSRSTVFKIQRQALDKLDEIINTIDDNQ